MTPPGVLLALAALLAVAPVPEEGRTPIPREEEATPRPTLDDPPEDPGEDRRLLLQVDELVARGEEFLDRANRRSEKHARRLFTLALREEPEHGAARAGLARCATTRYLRRWEEDDRLIDEALEQARAAVEWAPGEPRAHAALAVAYMIAGDQGPALVEADAAWELRGERPPSWVTQVFVQSLIARGKPGEALRIVDEALSIHPSRAQFHALRGVALTEMGEPREGAVALRRALVLEPDLVAAALSLARAYDRLGNRPAASALYIDIVAKHPEEKARVQAIAADSLIAGGAYEKALAGLEKIRFGTRRGLGEGTRLYMKATCLEKLRRPEEARPLYRKVIDEYPFASYGAFSTERLVASSFEALSRMALQEGNVEEAARLLEEALTKPRPTLSLFLELANLYGDYGLHTEAVSALRRAETIDFGPRQTGPRTVLYVAWARALRRKEPGSDAPLAEVLEALERFRPVLAATEDFPYFLEAARACAIAGDTARGLDWLKRAVDLGYRRLEWIREDPEMRSLAELPGFESLLRTAAGH
jgi:tetratricopeptide (TPR) repeat protein